MGSEGIAYYDGAHGPVDTLRDGHVGPRTAWTARSSGAFAAGPGERLIALLFAAHDLGRVLEVAALFAARMAEIHDGSG